MSSFGSAHERHGDHRPLAHPTGEFVRVVDSGPALGDADWLSISSARAAATFFAASSCHSTTWATWSQNRHRGVEARHRVLEDHGQIVAAAVAPCSRNGRPAGRGRRSGTVPAVIVAGGECSSRMIDSDVTVLPDHSRRRCRASRPMAPRTTRRRRRGRARPAPRTPGRGRRPPAGRPTVGPVARRSRRDGASAAASTVVRPSGRRRGSSPHRARPGGRRRRR